MSLKGLAIGLSQGKTPSGPAQKGQGSGLCTQHQGSLDFQSGKGENEGAKGRAGSPRQGAGSAWALGTHC